VGRIPTAEEMEKRRHDVEELLRRNSGQGQKTYQKEIAEAMGISAGGACAWLKAEREELTRLGVRGGGRAGYWVGAEPLPPGEQAEGAKIRADAEGITGVPPELAGRRRGRRPRTEGAGGNGRHRPPASAGTAPSPDSDRGSGEAPTAAAAPDGPDAEMHPDRFEPIYTVEITGPGMEVRRRLPRRSVWPVIAALAGARGFEHGPLPTPVAVETAMQRQWCGTGMPLTD